jgi:DNA-binding NtrC family response regulator
MGGREIIIADGDTRYRSQVTDFFKRSGYRVETADSVEQVLASVQENMAQVLLLGSGFSTKIAASDLIHLLKKCSRQLHIILVSDGMTLAQARRVRQEGIFYQALKPATGSDTDELGQAVACAFRKQRASILIEPDPGLQNQQSRKTTSSLLVSSVPWTASLLALLFATSYYFLAPAAEKVHNGTSAATLIFLAFFALIVVNQVLPIFRGELARGIRAQHAAHQSTPRGRKLAAIPEQGL